MRRSLSHFRRRTTRLACPNMRPPLSAPSAVVSRAGGSSSATPAPARSAAVVCKPRPVALLVLSNAMPPGRGEPPGEWGRNPRHAEAKREQNQRDGREADAPFDPLVDFFHDVPQSVMDDALA